MKEIMAPTESMPASHGFTLLEVLMALSLAALLAGGAGLVRWEGFVRRFNAREGRSQTVALLRGARWRAVSEGLEYGVSLLEEPGPSRWCGALMRREGSGWKLVETRMLPGVERALSTGRSLLEFNPDGTSSSGSLVLFLADGNVCRISLTAATGRVRLYSGDPG